jgi:hypothetical protein
VHAVECATNGTDVCSSEWGRQSEGGEPAGWVSARLLALVLIGAKLVGDAVSGFSS